MGTPIELSRSEMMLNGKFGLMASPQRFELWLLP
jgi:hypothetical protein